MAKKIHTIMSVNIGSTNKGVSEDNFRVSLYASIGVGGRLTLVSKYYNEDGDNPLNSNQSFDSMGEMLGFISAEFGKEAAVDLAEDIQGCLTEHGIIGRMKFYLDRSYDHVEAIDKYFVVNRRD